MINFISMHNFGDDFVDCRRLQIECEFFGISEKQLKDLTALCIHSANDWLGDAFILDWQRNNRRVSAETLLLKNKKSDDVRSFRCFGNTKKSPFNSIKQMDMYAKKHFHHMNMSGWETRVSVDYWDVYRQLFSNVSDPEKVRQNLLSLFRMENRYYKQRWIGTDVLSHFNSFPYSNKKDLFFGRFDFRIALPCLGENASEFSNLALEFLKKVTSIIPNVSGRITASPSIPPSFCSSYMDYFGGTAQYCPLGRESDLREKEWTDLYFLKGVEWCNLLTPLQTTLVKDRPHTNKIAVTYLPNGGSIVSVNKTLLQTQVSDLCRLKEYLYPVLYPGGIEIPLDELLNPQKKGYIVKPRHQWEVVPVLEDEIKAYPDKIVIKYQTNRLLKTGDGTVS